MESNKEALEEYKFKWIPDMKRSDYMIDLQYQDGMSYPDILRLAMKREEQALKMYNELQIKTDNAGHIKVLKVLCQEEAKHKLFLETLYDDSTPFAKEEDVPEIRFNEKTGFIEGVCPKCDKAKADTGADKSSETHWVDEITGNSNRGIGLTLVKDIVENYFGGSIEVKSEAGTGTEFVVIIPKISF